MLRLVGQVSRSAARAVVPVMAGGREASSGLVRRSRERCFQTLLRFWRCKPFAVWPVWESQLVWGERLACRCKECERSSVWANASQKPWIPDDACLSHASDAIGSVLRSAKLLKLWTASQQPQRSQFCKRSLRGNLCFRAKQKWSLGQRFVVRRGSLYSLSLRLLKLF